MLLDAEGRRTDAADEEGKTKPHFRDNHPPAVDYGDEAEQAHKGKGGGETRHIVPEVDSLPGFEGRHVWRASGGCLGAKSGSTGRGRGSAVAM